MAKLGIDMFSRDEVIRLALEAGGGWSHGIDSLPLLIGDKQLERFAALVAAHEREECARVCEQLERPDDSTGWNQGSLDCAKAIRARGDL